MKKRLRRMVNAQPFGTSWLRVTRSGITGAFTAVKAGLRFGVPDEHSVGQWLEDLPALCAAWSAE